jgi:hypothetical protein
MPFEFHSRPRSSPNTTPAGLQVEAELPPLRTLGRVLVDKDEVGTQTYGSYYFFSSALSLEVMFVA